MTSSAKISDYFGVGTHSARPASPSIPSGCGAVYWETDTSKLFVWDGSAWNQAVSSGPSTPSIVQSKVQAESNIGTTGVTLGSAPTNGNLLVALACFSSAVVPTPNSGWTVLHNGALTGGPDYPSVLFKWAGASESATQNPFSSGLTGGIALYELSGGHGIEQTGGTIATVGTSLGQAVTSEQNAALVLYLFTSTTSSATLPTSITNGSADGTASLNSGLSTAQLAAGAHATIATAGSLTVTANYSGSQTITSAFAIVH